MLSVAVLSAVTVFAGLDAKTVVSIPAAIVAVVGLGSYAVGAIRPFAVRKPRSWHVGETTQFSTAVLNRSLLFDRSVETITFVVVPKLWQRLVKPWWRRKPQFASYIPWGASIEALKSQPLKLTKRQAQTITGEVRDGQTKSGKYELPGRVRIQAHGGAKRSRSARVRQTAAPQRAVSPFSETIHLSSPRFDSAFDLAR